MVRATTCCSLLITVCLLLWLLALGNAQSGTRRPQEPRGVPVAPAAPTTSPAERRVALVIGNGQYQYVSRLDNPTNDARLIAETLLSVGFTLIGGKAQLDLNKTGFDRMVQEFGQGIQNAGVALFYYAGHGLQVRGSNYLVPVSANPTREADVDFQLLNADLVLRQMEGAGTRLNFLILDACRNNPFAGRGLRTAGGGLAQMQAPEGTLISYATQPGNVAQDGTDGHSPYTRAFANAVRKPGLDVFAVFNETGLAVKQRTGGAQQPWVSSSPIAGQFYFTGAPDQQPTGGKDDAVEIAFWNSVKDDKTPDAFQTYLESYPQGKFAALARLKLKQLSEPPSSVASSSVSPSQPPATTAIAPQSSPGSRVAGETLYQTRCAPCHGPDGKAATPTAQALNPKPRDLAEGAYMNQLSNEHLAKVIKEGGPAVGKSPIMPANTDLNDQQIQDIIAFVRTIAGSSVSPSQPPATTAIVPQPSPGSRVAGETLYQVRCAPCHGPDGKAATPTAQALNPKPHDHTDRDYMNHLSNEHLAKVIKNGGAVVGKSPIMPAQTDLNDQQIQDLIAFMRTLAGSS